MASEAAYNTRMHLGIISDTHDRLESISRALEFFAQQRVDIVLHCGDWKSLSTMTYLAQKARSLALPVRGVLGNNDTNVTGFLQLSRRLPGDLEVQEGVMELSLDGKNIAVYHGHHKPTLRSLLADTNYDIICLGHTHKPMIEKSPKQLIINPGSTAFSIPRSKTWQPSVAIVRADTMTADIAYLT